MAKRGKDKRPRRRRSETPLERERKQQRKREQSREAAKSDRSSICSHFNVVSKRRTDSSRVFNAVVKDEHTLDGQEGGADSDNDHDVDESTHGECILIVKFYYRLCEIGLSDNTICILHPRASC